ncbi:MAG: MFS transporter [Dehalococcoidia bacterium]|nr:MFS transporter [Dehalococcoidia bacterium]
MVHLLTHGEAKQAEHSLKNSSIEGAFYGGMVGLGDQFTGAYAVALRATSFEMGLLTALPMLLGALSNSFSFRAARLLGTRKRVVLLFAFLQGVVWLPIVVLSQVKGDYRADILIACVTFYAIFASFIVPCWNSIMGEIVPARLRGKYFSRRSRVGTLSTLVFSLVGGILIYLLRDHGLTGFAIAFLAAFVLRTISVTLLTTLMEMHADVKAEQSIQLRRFLWELPRTNLGRTILFIMLMNFAVNLASPHFTPYMLRDLHMDYITFTLLTVGTAVGAVLTVTHWGAAADRFGNRQMLALAGVLVGFVPLLWLVSSNVYYLAFAQVFSGFAWAGFNLASVNFLFDGTTDRNRTAYLALFNAVAGAAGAAGALLGGWLIPYLPVVLGSSIVTMFLISGVLRLAIGVGFIPLLHEVRRVSQATASDLFHTMLAGRPTHFSPTHGRLQTFQTPATHTDTPPVHHIRRIPMTEEEWERAKDLV